MRPAFPLALVLAASAAAVSAVAQTPPNCALAAAENPDRQVLTCAGGLVMEIEAAASLGFLADSTDPAGRNLTLEGGAALIEVEPAALHLQIRTPHAIAAVRGTIYAVDAGAEITSVFVQRGRVEVSPASGGQDAVVLGEGEGVDVQPGQPLVVKSWGAARIEKLLARFGR